jgi:hypothetical protein
MSNATLREMIDLYLNFEEHRDCLIDESFISKLKNHVVYEINFATTLEILSLLQIFKRDTTFKKFLAHSLLESVDKGNLASICKELPEIILLVMELKEYRNEFIPILLNSESFYSQYYSYYPKCLIRIN